MKDDLKYGLLNCVIPDDNLIFIPTHAPRSILIVSSLGDRQGLTLTNLVRPNLGYALVTLVIQTVTLMLIVILL